MESIDGNSVSKNIICPVNRLYKGVTSTAKVDNKISEPFKTYMGIRQGYILFRLLFNKCKVYIEEKKIWIKRITTIDSKKFRVH